MEKSGRKKKKHSSRIWCRKYFDILNRLGATRDRDGQTDRLDNSMCRASPSCAVKNVRCKSCMHSCVHRRRSGWNSEGDAWRAPKVGRCRMQWGYGEGCPLSSPLGVCGASWAPPAGSGAEPRPKTDFGVFWRPKNAPFCIYMTKIWGGQFALASPYSKFWGTCPPRPPVICAHACVWYLSKKKVSHHVARNRQCDVNVNVNVVYALKQKERILHCIQSQDYNFVTITSANEQLCTKVSCHVRHRAHRWKENENVRKQSSNCFGPVGCKVGGLFGVIGVATLP